MFYFNNKDNYDNNPKTAIMVLCAAKQKFYILI